MACRIALSDGSGATRSNVGIERVVHWSSAHDIHVRSGIGGDGHEHPRPLERLRCVIAGRRVRPQARQARERAAMDTGATSTARATDDSSLRLNPCVGVRWSVSRNAVRVVPSRASGGGPSEPHPPRFHPLPTLQGVGAAMATKPSVHPVDGVHFAHRETAIRHVPPRPRQAERAVLSAESIDSPHAAPWPLVASTASAPQEARAYPTMRQAAAPR